MDYKKIYDQFIADRLLKYPSKKRAKGRELHHIVPRGGEFGGSDAADNLVCLTPSDHLFAHLLLAKVYGGYMSSAFHLMLQNPRYRGRTSRLAHAKIREEARDVLGAQNRGKAQHPNLAAAIAAYNATRKLPKDVQESLRQARVEAKNAPKVHASKLPRTPAQLALLERGRRLPMTPARFAGLEIARHLPRTAAQLAAISKTGKQARSEAQYAALAEGRKKGVVAAAIAARKRKQDRLNSAQQQEAHEYIANQGDASC